jgi:hypothetical protein
MRTNHREQLGAQQRVVLLKLYALLREATDCGLLDAILPECANPDSVNDFVDAVASMMRSR